MERELSMLMSRVKIGGMIDEATMPFKELMAYHKCAMMQVEVQLRTLRFTRLQLLEPRLISSLVNNFAVRLDHSFIHLASHFGL